MWWVFLLGFLSGGITLIALGLPPRSVRPGGSTMTPPPPPPVTCVVELDVHPRHVCRLETITARWQTSGADSGSLVAMGLGLPPFFNQPLNVVEVVNGVSPFAADYAGYFQVELDVFQGRSSCGNRQIVIQTVDRNYSTQADIYAFTVEQLSYVEGPRRGWQGRRRVTDIPTPTDQDDWSPRIGVADIRYREAGERDVIVSWQGREIAHLSARSAEAHLNSEDVRVVGDWEVFVLADSPVPPILSVTIDLRLRCAA